MQGYSSDLFIFASFFNVDTWPEYNLDVCFVQGFCFMICWTRSETVFVLNSLVRLRESPRGFVLMFWFQAWNHRYGLRWTTWEEKDKGLSPWIWVGVQRKDRVRDTWLTYRALWETHNMIKREECRMLAFFCVSLCSEFLVWGQASASPTDTRCYFQQPSICYVPTRMNQLGHSQGHIPYQGRDCICYFVIHTFFCIILAPNLWFGEKRDRKPRSTSGDCSSPPKTIQPKSVPVLYYILE